MNASEALALSLNKPLPVRSSPPIDENGPDAFIRGNQEAAVWMVEILALIEKGAKENRRDAEIEIQNAWEKDLTQFKAGLEEQLRKNLNELGYRNSLNKSMDYCDGLGCNGTNYTFTLYISW